MIKTLLVKRLIAVGFSFVVATAIPFAVQDKPRIKWVWDNLGPVVVDAAQDKVDQLD